MKKSDQINELLSALSIAQAEMKRAIKYSKNPFYKSHFADLEAIWDVGVGPLTKAGLAISQGIEIRETGMVLETLLGHKSGQWIMFEHPINPLKNDPQGVGSAETYARRYSLAAIAGIVAKDEDDDGETAMARGHSNAPISHPKAQSTESKALSDIAKINNFSKPDPGEFKMPLSSSYPGRRLKDLTNDQRTDLYKKFSVSPPRTNEGKETWAALKAYLSPTASKLFNEDESLP